MIERGYTTFVQMFETDEVGVVEPTGKDWAMPVCMNTQILVIKKARDNKFGMKIAVY